MAADDFSGIESSSVKNLPTNQTTVKFANPQQPRFHMALRRCLAFSGFIIFLLSSPTLLRARRAIQRIDGHAVWIEVSAVVVATPSWSCFSAPLALRETRSASASAKAQQPPSPSQPASPTNSPLSAPPPLLQDNPVNHQRTFHTRYYRFTLCSGPFTFSLVLHRVPICVLLLPRLSSPFSA